MPAFQINCKSCTKGFFTLHHDRIERTALLADGIESRDVSIHKIVNGGYGIGTIEGSVVLVPFSVPGDLLRVKPLRSVHGGRNRTLFCEIETIVKPSPLRVEPRCPIFGVCGGCDFGHISYQFELEAKMGVLLEDLERIGGHRVEQQLEILSSPSEYGYRNHAQIKADTQGRVGFFRKKSHEIVPLPSGGCLLLHTPLNDFVLELVKGSGLTEGSIRIRSNGEGQVFSRGASGRKDDSHVVYRVGDLQFRIGVDDFFQVNSYLTEVWIGLVERNLHPEPDDRIYDLFCGSGLIALSLAHISHSVTGIEANGSAVRNARLNASLNGIDNASFAIGDLTRQTDLSQWEPERKGTLKVVVDPPRTGLARHLIDSITLLEPAVIVYVSCNSATFARDVREFVQRGYRPERISLIDMFPRTRHIETVARFVKYS